jgi:hypothetical protein
MINTQFAEEFEKYINQLISEISAYKDEQNIWKIDAEIKNSAGNLALHLLGNLNDRIGAALGGSSYVRNRAAEFADKNIPREKLLSELKAVIVTVKNSLAKLKDEDFFSVYPGMVEGKKDKQVIFVMVFLIAHFNYHLGQVNYHRRLLDK